MDAGPLLVTLRSAFEAVTVVVAVAESLAAFASFPVTLTLAVFPIVPPEVVVTTSVKAPDAPDDRPAFEQLTVPLAPTAGVVQVHPAGEVSETN
jgi:hypothetical protein